MQHTKAYNYILDTVTIGHGPTDKGTKNYAADKGLDTILHYRIELQQK